MRSKFTYQTVIQSRIKDSAWDPASKPFPTTNVSCINFNRKLDPYVGLSGLFWTTLVFCSLYLNSGFSKSDTELYRHLSAFSDVLKHVRSDYVRPVSDEKLIENAIQGMLTALDPHSSYISQEKYQSMMTSMKGEFVGSGLEFTLQEGKIIILTPLDNSPAARAGLKPQDQILEINGTVLYGLSLSNVDDLMKGQAQEPLTLTIQREQTPPFSVTFKREVIKFNPVQWKTKDSIAYVRISNFLHDKTGLALQKALKAIQIKLKKPKGLIIDLRNNPGGLLDQGLFVADLFLTSGKIVSVKGRKSNSTIVHSTTKREKFFKGVPIIILINEGTASSAEIVAGALKDHKRAILMGMPSSGKGSVQTILPIPPGYTAIRLTTGLYYTPSGASIEGQGIRPDIIVSEEDSYGKAFSLLKSLENRP